MTRIPVSTISTPRSRHHTAGQARRLLQLAAVLAASVLAGQSDADTFSSAATGNYNANATWGGATNPAGVTADTVTINAHTVTLTAAADATLD